MNLTENFMNLIDGSLDDVSEKIYFDELALSGDSRQDFKDSLAIALAMKSAPAVSGPSPESTARIFKEFDIQFPLNQNKSFISKIGINKPFQLNFFSGFASGLCACIIAVFIFSLLLPSHPAQNTSSTISNKRATPPKGAKPDLLSAVRQKNNIVRKFIAAASTRAALEQQDNNYEIPALSHAAPGSASGCIKEFKKSKSSLNKMELSRQPKIFDSENTYGLSVDISNGAVWNIPYPKLTPGKLSPFNNLCASLWYSLSDNLKIGVEGRQESFYMEFDGTEQDSMLYNYMETASFLTLGAKINYRFDNVFTGLAPFVQAGAGWNRGGIALRPSLGLGWQPYSNLTFNAGLEYTWYWFAHQRKWFTTSKLGLIYGVSYSF